MNRLKLMWIVFKIMMRDDMMQMGTILMINGMFYSVLSTIIGVGSTIDIMDIMQDVITWMYIFVLPAHFFWPRTIKPEIVTIH